MVSPFGPAAFLLLIAAILKANLLLFLVGKRGAGEGREGLGPVPRGDCADDVLGEGGEGALPIVAEDLEEDVGDVLVDVIDERFLASGVRVNKISDVHHPPLVEDDVLVLLSRVLHPLFRWTMHRKYIFRSARPLIQPFQSHSLPKL